MYKMMVYYCGIIISFFLSSSSSSSSLISSTAFLYPCRFLLFVGSEKAIVCLLCFEEEEVLLREEWG